MALNVLILTPIYPWPGDPPEGIFVHRQVQQLVRQGVRCRVLAYHPGLPGLPRPLAHLSGLRHHVRWLTRPGRLDGVPVERVFFPRPARRGPDLVPRIAQVLIRHIDARPVYQSTDVVYAHWLWTGGAAALALRERWGWPVAAIARGSEMHAWQTAHPYCREHVQRVIRDADLVLANCEALRRRAADMAPHHASRVQVVYNGCDADQFCPAADRLQLRRRLSLPPNRKLLLVCGAVTVGKGMHELVEAWRSFSARYPEWMLVVVGRRIDRGLARRLRRVTPRRVRLVGRVSPERVAMYMQAADAYVHPSRSEGLANATLEAMATGLPVVATDVGGQREAIRDGETGWLIPARNPAALAHALAELAADEARATRRGLAARRTVQSRFGPARHAARLKVLLERTAARGEAASSLSRVSAGSTARPF